MEARGSYKSLEQPQCRRPPLQQASPSKSSQNFHRPTPHSSTVWESHQWWRPEGQQDAQPCSWAAASPAYNNNSGRGFRLERGLPGLDGTVTQPQAINRTREHGGAVALRGRILGIEVGSGIDGVGHGGSMSHWRRQRQLEWLDQQERLSAHHCRTEGL
eukprot:scaffold90329_cov16-Tisochrysis_lutea.AAC.1